MDRLPVKPHPENAPSSIKDTELGMVRLPVKPLQSWKAPELIEVTVFGMVKSPVKLLQLLKALLSIDFTV